MMDDLDRALYRMRQVAEGRVTPGVPFVRGDCSDPWPGDQTWGWPDRSGQVFDNGAWRPWRPDDDLVHRHAD